MPFLAKLLPLTRNVTEFIVHLPNNAAIRIHKQLTNTPEHTPTIPNTTIHDELLRMTMDDVAELQHVMIFITFSQQPTPTLLIKMEVHIFLLQSSLLLLNVVVIVLMLL